MSAMETTATGLGRTFTPTDIDHPLVERLGYNTPYVTDAGKVETGHYLSNVDVNGMVTMGRDGFVTAIVDEAFVIPRDLTADEAHYLQLGYGAGRVRALAREMHDIDRFADEASMRAYATRLGASIGLADEKVAAYTDGYAIGWANH